MAQVMDLRLPTIHARLHVRDSTGEHMNMAIDITCEIFVICVTSSLWHGRPDRLGGSWVFNVFA